MRKIVILILLSFNVSVGSFAQREQDSLALVALYNSTAGLNWTNKTNWLGSGPISNWFGITVFNNRVYNIYLNFNNLTGTIPSEIGNLTALTAFSLHANNIDGIIPIEIGNLKNLQNLSLGSNNLSGTIPGGVWSLTLLSVLHVGTNKLTGQIPPALGNLKNLQMLDLTDNQFSGSIPVEIGNLINLIGLGLRDNNFSGEIPAGIFEMRQLKDFYLNNNHFTGTIPSSIGNLSNLTWFSINNNKLIGDIPTEINNLTKCKNFFLQDNHLDGLPQITLTSVDNFDFQNNRFTFEDLEQNIGFKPTYNFIYSPQDSIGIRMDTIRIEGQDFTFSITCGGNYNQYQWYKNNTIIPSATSSTYTIPTLIQSDAGSYICAITNSVVTGLTIYSRPIKLQISTITSRDDNINIGLKIFPNPTNRILYLATNISLASDTKIEILDIYGKVYIQKDWLEGCRQELDLVQLSKGMYVIKISNKNMSYSQKIVIQ